MGSGVEEGRYPEGSQKTRTKRVINGYQVGKRLAV